jgi:hypothetical protein
VELLRSRLYDQFRAGGEDIDISAQVSEDAEMVLDGRLSALLWAADGAFTREAHALKRNANEADRRHDWDALLYKFFVPSVDSTKDDCDVL